jgi:acyl-CoA thioesterase FadM
MQPSRKPEIAELLVRGKLLTTVPGRVTMVDTDASGLLYFGAVYRWSEAVFGGWMLSLGHGIGAMVQDGYGTPCVHSEAQYRRALAMDDALEFHLYANALGRTSFGFVTDVFHVGDDEPSVVISSRHVYGRMRSPGNVHAGFERLALPEWLVGAMR